MTTYISNSSEETFLLGKKLGASLPRQCILCFFGELAAGKTTFIKGLVEGAAEIPSDSIASPTFVYLNIYEGKNTIYHFDLYRLSDADEFIGMGFHEFFSQSGICCIEWSERIAPILPLHRYEIHLFHSQANQRTITVNYKDGTHKNNPF